MLFNICWHFNARQLIKVSIVQIYFDFICWSLINILNHPRWLCCCVMVLNTY